MCERVKWSPEKQRKTGASHLSLSRDSSCLLTVICILKLNSKRAFSVSIRSWPITLKLWCHSANQIGALDDVSEGKRNQHFALLLKGEEVGRAIWEHRYIAKKEATCFHCTSFVGQHSETSLHISQKWHSPGCWCIGSLKNIALKLHSDSQQIPVRFYRLCNEIAQW